MAAKSSATGNPVRELDMQRNCENWFAGDVLEKLKKYFARHIYRDGLTFRQWCAPQALETITLDKFKEVTKCERGLANRLFLTLRNKGILIKKR